MIAACLAVVVLAALLVYQSRQHAQERADLLQRIQAPEMAVMTHADFQPPRSIPFDDDEQFWASREDQP